MFYSIIRGLLAIYVKLAYRFSVTGSSNEPSQSQIIVAANHHSAWDPIFVGVAIRRHLRFMAKIELFQYPVLNWIIRGLGAFPVNRGKGDSKAIRSALSILKSGQALAMFPEGTRVRAGEAREAQNGIALLATRTGAPVLPVRVYRKGRQVEVRIGQPVKFQLINGKDKADKDDLSNFSQEIMTKIQNL